MTALIYTILVVAMLTFVVASGIRAWRYARLPLHLRWELYPVPHETRRRAAYGGSYFESAEWWNARSHQNAWGAVTFMIREIVCLHALWRSHRTLWYRSFPFHGGLYLMTGAGGALAVLAAASAAGHPVPDAAEGFWLRESCRALGWSGLTLTLSGAVALLLRRLTNPGLRGATTVGDLFNLAFFATALALIGVGYLARPAGAPGALATVTGLLTWDLSLHIPALLGAGLVACAVLLAYIPMTHMSHFIAKYFTYHAVRWDDRPQAGNAKLASTVMTQLAARPTWAAGHVGADGRRSWGEIASTNPHPGTRR